jgi:hypothetical protein
LGIGKTALADEFRRQAAAGAPDLQIARGQCVEGYGSQNVCERLSRRHSIVRPAGSEKPRDGTVAACYEFVHVLYREVCYHRISLGRRVKLHRRLGEWTESHREPLNEVASSMAGHFEQSGDWLRAIKYLHLAADTAGRRFAYREATAILDHSLHVASKLREAERTASEIEILEELAAIHTMLVDDVRAIESYEALAARAAQGGLIGVEVRGLLDMATPVSWTSSRRSLEILERVLHLSAPLEDPLLRAKTRARGFALRLWQEWNQQGAEEFRHAFAEILDANDRAFSPLTWPTVASSVGSPPNTARPAAA